MKTIKYTPFLYSWFTSIVLLEECFTLQKQTLWKYPIARHKAFHLNIGETA